MQLRQILPKTANDYWEERAEKVLSHFNYQYPDEIDMYEICWRYGIKIKPLDKLFLDTDIPDGIKACSFPGKKGRRGVIYLSPGLDAIKKKLLLAEEFCHIYAHHISQLHMDNSFIAKTENQAKRMSAYLLMPTRFLEDVYVAAADQMVVISDIADYFVVTEEFARYRLKLIFNRRVDGFATIKNKLGCFEWFE
ncbi:hypothetical protein C0971_10195 [Bacillus methanolicus]|uniref:ImmA/IrrE family metallo-endopeptidase n=1 Tax=Bacillus methanolicus TaxID=1471 RepID=UPI00200BAA3F|nr:ImmA/IrrE family metallo-endopeptidase [Bacillus methanolicus]UQD52342.1 hypothetical protein C0971_10195 [Bacillus methanolicus]